MHFSDIFKKSFLEGYTSTDLSLRFIAFTFVIASLFAIYIFFAYRVMTRKTFYDKSFNISLSMVTVIITGIIITIQSSLVVSLGMVGALSIVRFRTAIKNPMDLSFMFWAIANGITIGAGYPGVALITSVILTIGCTVVDAIPIAKAPKLLIVNADASVRDTVIATIKENVGRIDMKSETVTGDKLSMIIELRARDNNSIVSRVSEISGVSRCSLVSHDGEVTF